MAIINVDLNDTVASWRTKTNDIATLVGDLTLLDTTSKDSIVDAMNELKYNFDSDLSFIGNLSSDISSNLEDLRGIVGTLESLNTNNKDNIVSAINELEGRIINVYNNSGTLLNS